jgi:hypothetical protein
VGHPRALLIFAAIASSAALVAIPALGSAHPLPGAPKCPVFPPNNPWNQRVDRLPVAKDSARLIGSIGLDDPVHPDFGTVWDGAPNGIPIVVVSGHTRRVPVHFDYADESNPGPYPVPPKAPIEGGPNSTGDRHVIVVDRSTCMDYELFAAYPHDGGAFWTAGSGAIVNLRSNHLRPAGWTSADAAGLPILPGLARYDEASAGTIDHALRITVPKSQQAYIWPARHSAGSGSTNLPPMGLRLRLKASVDITSFPPQARAVAQALKTYGAIVADNGSAWYISGTHDERWSNDQLSALSQLIGSDFEAVDVSSLRVSADSGAAR